MLNKSNKLIALKEILAEFIVNIILILFPLCGVLILSLIFPDGYLSNLSGDEMMWAGALASVVILYFISSVAMLVSKVRDKIRTSKSPVGKKVNVIVDRPLGTYHPKHKDIYYSVNYGYIDGVVAGDGEEQDAYILGVDNPVNEFVGTVIAVIHRLNDNEDKWVVVPEGFSTTKEEIMKQVEFQEKYFETEIYML